VTDSPTAAWTAQQVVEAFPHDSAPRFLIRDRDRIFGGQFRRRVKAIGLDEVLTTPRSPWQNPFAERVIGTIRRELLDHVILRLSAFRRRSQALRIRSLSPELEGRCDEVSSHSHRSHENERSTHHLAAIASHNRIPQSQPRPVPKLDGAE